ncbi:hypothetical protein GCM10008171_11550 [Methylopila jiangsuensis]|uniref:Uncharacterized protein n=1 Tax=Methylopila jiangsuensis TaxID=586230 RepID=A0A9W6JE42_9HYPH|nr:glycosyl hydrolase 108 family protein [Methylopila jiangsuensis]MDR6286141.1 lysozyme family protein [Methylopila jiangsuensis]GLK75901.1 hypothetical protein GCM10008171_11550 [Methylopila jiangsuensis]
MGTGAGLLNRAGKHLGQAYKNVDVPKDAADYGGPWDCAEFASWLVFQESGQLYGCLDNAVAPAVANAYTGAWRDDVARRGKRISVEQAAATKGAFLLRYPPAAGKMGHIALSDGQGGTIEAMDLKHGVARGSVAGRRWDTGVLVPWIDYETPAEVPPVAGPSVIYAVNAPNMRAEVVKRIQTALRDKGFYKDPIDGVFGMKTMDAVALFQQAAGVVTDGEVGQITAKKLGVNLLEFALDVGGQALRSVVAANPLIALATSLLPAIARTIAGDPAGAAAGEVARAVADTTGASEAEVAKARVEADPQLAATLRIRLAEIANEQEQARHEREAAERAAADAKDAALRKEANDRLEAQLKDVADARGKMVQYAQIGGPAAKAPVYISYVVTIGFFVTLFLLLGAGKYLGIDKSSDVYQIINLVIGALIAAFSTVVSFWLGSSQGSRNKDEAVSQERIEQTKQATQAVAASQELVKEVVAAAAASPRPPAAAAALAGAPKASRFDACVSLVLDREGGFADHPEDNGGPTNLGITLRTLSEWRGAAGASVADLKALKPDQAKEIYRALYWNRMRCDDLPAGVDLMAFDFAVNAGPAASARLLQKAAGAEADGSVGPATLAAVGAAPPDKLIEAFHAAKLAHYRGLSDWKTFGRGWVNRAAIVREKALAMARPETAAAA